MTANCAVWAFLTLLLFYSPVNCLHEPHVVEVPKDITTVMGKEILLKCIIENLPLEDDLVQWTKDGFAFGYDRDIPGYKYSVIGDVSLGEYNFLIKDAMMEDEAQYECQVRVNHMRAKAMVTVLVPPKGPTIENTKEDGSINVLANAESFLTCTSAGGKPAGKLTWYKDGVEILHNVSYDETSSDGKLRNSNATLKLWPNPGDDGDLYECKMTMDQRFLGTNGIEDLTSMVAVQLNVQKPPVATVSIPDSAVLEGVDVYARCDSFTSNPPATSYKWFINGDLLKGSTKDFLRILEVNKTMNGAVIACAAVNDVGESAMSKATLTVLYAPILRVAPKNVVSDFTAVVNMSCAWESNPPARITWYKRGRMNVILGEGEHLKIDVQDQTAAGIYVCVGDAYGVPSKSVTARLDVLGPPIIDSALVQMAFVGDVAILNCSVESTPGISQVSWMWKRRGTVLTLRNNETKMIGGKLKYRGLMHRGRFVASLAIEDVQEEDFTEYNCTIENAYGYKSATLKFEEQPSVSSAMMVPVIVAGILAFVFLVSIILLTVFCVRRKRQEKSTTFPPDHQIHVDGDEPSREDNRTDPILTKKLLSDEDIQAPSTPPSIVSQSVVRERIDAFQNCAHNDDGYHTEEANSWNRNEMNQSPSSSPARSGRQEFQPRGSITPSIQMTTSPRELEEAASPYPASDAASDTVNNDYLRYQMQMQPYPQYSLQYTPDVVELPPVARAASPLQMYTAPVSQALPPNYYQIPPSSSPGFRNMAQGYPPLSQRSRAGSNAPSMVSSHRSITPSPYVLGRATPNSLLMDRGMYQIPITPQPLTHPSSSQSSLDQVPLPMNMQMYENPQINRLNSMASHASRSSEMLNKPMTARMATHV